MTAKVIDLASRRKVRPSRPEALGAMLAYLSAAWEAAEGHPELQATAVRWRAEVRAMFIKR